MSSKNILITGGAGYVGTHTVKAALKAGHSVVVFDNFYRGWREPLDILGKYGKLEVVEGDLRNKSDLSNLFSGRKFDAVIHLAAVCLVDESTKNPELYFETNTVGTLHLLEIMKENDVNKIVFISTCAVYGEPDSLPIKESQLKIPLNPYGESKLAAEKIIEWFGISHAFRYAILRCFNVCGADAEGEIGDSKKPSQLLMQNAIRGALGIEDFNLTCSKVDTEDGTPIRDYVDVEDLAEAQLRGLDYLNYGSVVCNVGNGVGLSVLDIVKKVEKHTGVKLKFNFGVPRSGEFVKMFADVSLIGKTLGWKSRKTLDQSITSLISWYTKHPEGYKN